MVADDEQLEGRYEVEKVLPHKPRGDPVATGQRFYLGFIPPPAPLRLLRDHQARAVQFRQVGRVAFVLLAINVFMSATVA